MLKLAAGIAKLAAAALAWHCAQLLLADGALAWMLASVGSTEKSAPVWHDAQAALADVGMWLAGLAVVLKSLMLAWHCTQSPLLGWGASATLKVPAVA